MKNLIFISVKRILFGLVGLLFTLNLNAQTNLAFGDLAFIGFNTIPSGGADQWVAFVVLAPIAPETQFHLTNKEWGNELVSQDELNPLNYTSFTPAKPAQGTYTVTVAEFLSVGEIIQISISGTPATSIGTLVVEPSESSSLNLQNGSNLGVYQDDRNSDGIPEFVSAFYWNSTDMELEYNGSGPFAPPYYKNTGLDLVSTSAGKNGLTTFYGSNNDKCGRFDPSRFQAIVGTTINYSDPLGNQLYYGTTDANIVWAFPSQVGALGCTDAGGPGDISVAETFLNDPVNVVFNQFLYTCTADVPTGIVNVPGWFAKAQTDLNWTPVITPNFSAETERAEVIIDCDFTVVDNTDFKVSKLTVSTGVTLTFEPSTTISVYFAQDNLGTIKLLTETADATTLGTMPSILPTSAALGGTYTVEGLISGNYGWFHMSSPIQSLLKDVVFVPLDLIALGGGAATKTFALNDGLVSSDDRNIYVWNPQGVVNGLNQVEFWQPIPNSLTVDDFSTQAYAIYIPQNSVPAKFTVTGPLLVPDSDIPADNPIGYSTQYASANASSPGYGAPWWSSSSTLKGWNFLRNPFMEYISVAQLNTEYVNLITDVNGQVFSDVIHQYAPNFSNSINVQNNYRSHNGTAGDDDGDFIAPFQAFFIQTASDGAVDPGIVTNIPTGKRSRSLGKSGKNPFWKTSTAGDKLSLSLWSESSENELTSVHLDERKNIYNLGYNRVSDALKLMHNREPNICIGIDSLNYGIKTIPVIRDSILLKIGSGSPIPNQLLTIANHTSFNTTYTSVLIDHKLNTRHVLNSSSYTFYNDTVYKGYRFTWKLYAPGFEPSVNQNVSAPNQWYSLYPDGYYVQGKKTYSRPIEIIDFKGSTILTIEPGRKKMVKVLEKEGLKPGVYLVKTEYGTLKIVF